MCCRPLCLILHIWVRFLCPAIGCCVHVCVRSASVSLNSDLTAWLDLDICGASRFDSQLAGWFVGNPWSIFFIAVLAQTVTICLFFLFFASLVS